MSFNYKVNTVIECKYKNGSNPNEFRRMYITDVTLTNIVGIDLDKKEYRNFRKTDITEPRKLLSKTFTFSSEKLLEEIYELLDEVQDKQLQEIFLNLTKEKFFLVDEKQNKFVKLIPEKHLSTFYFDVNKEFTIQQDNIQIKYLLTPQKQLHVCKIKSNGQNSYIEKHTLPSSNTIKAILNKYFS